MPTRRQMIAATLFCLGTMASRGKAQPPQATVLTIQTVEGCGLVRYTPARVLPVQDFVGYSWSGKCNDNKIHGKSVLLVRYVSGGTDRYEGEVADGRVSGPGKMTYSDGTSFVGTFSYGYPSRGKQYSPDGRLIGDGFFAQVADKGPVPPMHVAVGKWYFDDGSYVEGAFPSDATNDGVAISAATVGRVVSQNGTSLRTFVGPNESVSEEQVLAALSTRNEEQLAKIKSRKEEDKSADYWEGFNERQKKRDEYDAKGPSLLGQLGQIVGAAAEAYVQSRRPAVTPSVPTIQPPPSSGGASAGDCESFVSLLKDGARRWVGSANDINARVGQDQKRLFEGPCRNHPNAASYIATARSMISGGTPSQVKGLIDFSVPGVATLRQIDGGFSDCWDGCSAAADDGSRNNSGQARSPGFKYYQQPANNCLTQVDDAKFSGVINSCNFDVNFAFCHVSAKPGSAASYFICGTRSGIGLTSVPANSRTVMSNSRGSEGIRIASCRAPISPAEVSWGGLNMLWNCPE